MDASADLNMQRLQTVKNQLLPTPYQASKSIYLIELGTIRYIKHEHIFSVHATPYPLFLLSNIIIRDTDTLFLTAPDTIPDMYIVSRHAKLVIRRVETVTSANKRCFILVGQNIF